MLECEPVHGLESFGHTIRTKVLQHPSPACRAAGPQCISICEGPFDRVSDAAGRLAGDETTAALLDLLPRVNQICRDHGKASCERLEEHEPEVLLARRQHEHVARFEQ